MSLFRRPDPPPPEVVRFEMAQTDPDFARVRDVQHDALNALGASRAANQVRDQYNARLRESWRPLRRDR